MSRHVIAIAAALAVVLSGVVVAGPAHADGSGGTSYTWIGSSQDPSADNHSWTDQRNWSPAGVPTDGDSVTITSPNPTHCTAHVDNVPTVALVGFALSENPNLCGANVHGGAITVTGTFSWNGGGLDTPTTIATGASGSITGSSTRLNSLTQNLDVAGALTLSGVAGTSALRISAPKVMHVLAGGTLTSTGDNSITHTSCCVTPAKVINDGTLAVAGGTFGIGNVELDQNGTVATSLGGRLLTTTAPITAGANGTYTGNGSWAIENGAKARLTGTQTLGPGFQLEVGGLGVDAGMSLGGTATLAGTGTLVWTGGTIEANLTIAHGVSVRVAGAHTGNGRRILQGHDDTANPAVPATVINHGTITVEPGAAFMTAGTAALVNATDGTLSLAPGTLLTSAGCCVSPDRITNNGKLIVPSAASTAPVVITNIGYQATGGSTSIAPGRTLQLAGGAPNQLKATTLTGGGHLVITAPTAVSGPVVLGARTGLVLDSHGSLNGTATVSGVGALSWTGGAVSGSVTVSATGGVTLSGPAVKSLATTTGGAASRLTLRAHTTVDAGTARAHDVVELGSSTLTLAARTTVRGFVEFHNGTLVNTGDLTIDAGKSATAYKTGGALLNRGTVTVKTGVFAASNGYRQDAGATSVAAGARLTANGPGLALNHGVLAGAGTVSAVVVNTAGTVAPGQNGTGTLTVVGAYTQAGKGTMVLDLAKRRHDLLAVTGSVTLRGRLISHNLAGYHPAKAAKVNVLSSGALHDSLSCTSSSGTTTAGQHAGHWAPSPSSRVLALTWRAGARPHC